MSESLTPDPARWITESMRAEAARNPGSWVYAIDPFVDSHGRVPPYAIMGAWKVDDDGVITDEFEGNSKYRPSPRTMGMPEPTDPVDSAIQLAVTGYGPEAAISQALAKSSVFLIPDSIVGLGEHCAVAGGSGVVEAFTDVRHAPGTAPELRKMDALRLAASLPIDAHLKLNPGGVVSVQVPVADLLS
ncbi:MULTISPECIES: type VII secretion system-associated protein [unclassified Streptomyces]|uniref:type VII secretion system-associated protein n=1 Tax=unclassified Streptomyces TaxID=2593676 RepID=UPI00224FB8BF|nr:type VII secretion system-associated protein [Streptomyces sp. NBC_00047]MCX5605988.1 type VII secretion system-associated protein [Streptomyces sp. NBC_00047]